VFGAKQFLGRRGDGLVELGRLGITAVGPQFLRPLVVGDQPLSSGLILAPRRGKRHQNDRARQHDTERSHTKSEAAAKTCVHREIPQQK
jgi:hypothetical protein